jgi:hypothetical protein
VAKQEDLKPASLSRLRFARSGSFASIIPLFPLSMSLGGRADYQLALGRFFALRGGGASVAAPFVRGFGSFSSCAVCSSRIARSMSAFGVESLLIAFLQVLAAR